MANGWHRKRTTPADITRAKQYASSEHRAARKAIQAKLDAGTFIACCRCQRRITGPFHLDHDDHDRTRYRGPSHPACNLKAAGIKGAATVNAPRRKVIRTRTSRRWT